MDCTGTAFKIGFGSSLYVRGFVAFRLEETENENAGGNITLANARWSL
jgi:hypothetical protein